jgi:hypothetical protein
MWHRAISSIRGPERIHRHGGVNVQRQPVDLLHGTDWGLWLFSHRGVRAVDFEEWRASLQTRDDARHMIEEKLREAIDTLRTDATRVELWAAALSGFARPIPDYDFEAKYRLKQAPKEPSKSR